MPPIKQAKSSHHDPTSADFGTIIELPAAPGGTPVVTTSLRSNLETHDSWVLTFTRLSTSSTIGSRA